jgi:hypothetical protein
MSRTERYGIWKRKNQAVDSLYYLYDGRVAGAGECDDWRRLLYNKPIKWYGFCIIVISIRGYYDFIICGG